MLTRYLLALVGALAITIGLLLFMHDITERYVLRDPTRYFRILDFIPAPDRGRQRVPPPTDPRLAPEMPELEHDPLQEPRPLEPEPELRIDPEILTPAVVPESA
jgi:hypothetical protein